MNYLNRLISSLTLLGMVSLSGCALNKMVKMAQDQELTVTPSPLEVHADTVRFTTSAKLPLKMLKKNKTYTADVKYNYGGESVDAGNIVFNWADYPNAKTENPSKSETFSFPYQDAMRRGDLVVIGTAASANGKSKSTPEFKIADGVITTSKLVQPYYFYAYADHEYNTGEELEPTYVQFFFQQGSSYLRPTEVRSSRGRFLNAFIADKNVTRSVTITGTHSPEGAERINARLADDRAEAIEKYYRRQMGRYDYQGMADSIEFLPKAVVENWDSLKAELGRDERLTQTQKDEILSIINGSGSFEDKEDALHRLSSYRYLLSTVYPKTRTATTEILTVKEKKSLPEISALSKGITQGSVSMDTLSDAELAFSATLTPLLEEKEAIYQAAIKKNDRWQAHNDLATVYLQMAAEQTSESSMSNYLEQANTQLGIAKNRQESPEVYANMATLNMMQGDYDMGMQNLQKAMNMNPDEELRQGLNGMMGTLQIMRGMYSEAARSLSSAPDTAMVLYNRGLAQLLSDDFNNARASFDEAIQSDSELALAYYGSAIVAAQQGNEQAMADMLRQAIQKDASLRAYAIDDLEFQKYFDSQTFKDAVQ